MTNSPPAFADEGPPSETPPPAPNPSRSSGKRSRKKKGPSNSNDKEKDKSSPPSSGFSDGNRVLEGCGLSISGRFETVYSAPKTEGYFKFVDQAYEELVATKSEVRNVITRSEWQHVHALLLYARTSEVYFQVTGKKQPPPTRIPLPYDVRIFQPIWAILSDVGLIEDTDLKVRYVPLPVFPTSKESDSLVDLININECTLYDWKASWDEVTRDRSVLDAARTNVGLPPRTSIESDKPITREDNENVRLVLSFLSAWTKGKIYPDFDTTDKGVLDLDDDAKSATICLDCFDYSATVSDAADAELAFATIAKAVKTHKARRLIRSYPKPTDGERTFSFQGETIPNDPGSYGEWLGWDPMLWDAYRKVCDLMSPVSLWSPSFPREKNGTYMWVLPRYENTGSGFFMKLPKMAIPAPVWILGLILDMSTLPDERIYTFYVETDRTSGFNRILVEYIRAAIKSGIPTEQFR